MVHFFSRKPQGLRSLRCNKLRQKKRSNADRFIQIIEKAKSLVNRLTSCSVCCDKAQAMYCLECGHHCASCRLQQRDGDQSERNKCPTCHEDVSPSPTQLPGSIRHIFAELSTVLHKDTGKTSANYKKLPKMKVRRYWDDGVFKCFQCHWEISDGTCRCGQNFEEFEDEEHDENSADGSVESDSEGSIIEFIVDSDVEEEVMVPASDEEEEAIDTDSNGSQNTSSSSDQ